MLTVIEVVKKSFEFFASKGIESPRLNAELLVGHALGLPRMRLYLEFERPVSDGELGMIRELVRRRGRREPVQYILGFTEFFGLRLKTDRRALIPRPETELLVETVVARCTAPPGRILDLGTGGGAIALALASAFPQAHVTAVDASPEALALAAENAEATGLAARVHFVESDWFGGLPTGDAYDLIAANPPYLSMAEGAASAPEVRDHEPARALISGPDGFSDIERIVSGSAGALSPGGMLALETGTGHHARLERALRAAGYAKTESLRDLAGRDRFFLAWR
jgi:release factor glutamine methyltransferase